MDTSPSLPLSWSMRGGLFIGRLFCLFMGMAAFLSEILIIIAEFSTWMVMFGVAGAVVAKVVNPIPFSDFSWGQMIGVEISIIVFAIMIAILGVAVAIIGTLVWLAGHLLEPDVIGEVRSLLRTLVRSHTE